MGLNKFDGLSEYAYGKYVKPIKEREEKAKLQATIDYENSAAGRQEKLLKEISSDTKSLEELKRIADAAELRASVAAKEAESAKKDARFSKIISVVSILISLAALIVSIMR